MLNIEIDKNLKFRNKKMNGKELEPLLEIYKGKLFSFLIKNFTRDCVNLLGTKIFSIKKSYSRTITNIFSSWMFSLYIDYDFSGDYFFPTNFQNTTALENILIDLCKYDDTIINPFEKINKILFNLKINYKNQLDSLKSYEKSDLFINNRKSYNIKKIMINVKKNNNINQDEKKYVDQSFYKFIINLHFMIKDKRLNNILNNILIPTIIYEKMEQNYSGPKNKMDEYIWAIIYRYQLLGSNNHQLAVLPSIMNQMYQDYNLNFECFASSINNTFPNYCSIYWDLERFFGSHGSFFNIEPISGTFGFNPPYQKDVIEIGINKIFNFLEKANSSDNLTFIITIPIWDVIGRAHMKETYNNDLEKQNIDYGDFDIINKIRQSPFTKEILMIPKEKFTYVDHNFDLYKNKTIQNTYVIILSNQSLDLNKIHNYRFEIYSDVMIESNNESGEIEL